VPDLSGFAFGGEPVRWLWILPITERERQLAKERGATSLITQLAAQRRSWVVGRLPPRPLPPGRPGRPGQAIWPICSPRSPAPARLSAGGG
jgi:hypothetical protein